MNLSELFESFADIRYESSITEKEVLIAEILGSENAEVFSDICKWVFNPYRKISIRVSDDDMFTDKEDDTLDVPDLDDMRDKIIFSRFKVILCMLEERQVTGNQARDKVGAFLNALPEHMVSWFVAIFNKDLKLGVANKILERHIPDLAPKFSVQLCPSKQWSGTIPQDGFLVEPKLDGIRGICGPFGENGSYVMLSRNGRPLHNVSRILDSIAFMAAQIGSFDHLPPVFDGELWCESWETTSSITSTQSEHPRAQELCYYVFDWLPANEWSIQQCKAELAFRVRYLNKYISDHGDKLIVSVPSIHSADVSEIELICQSYVDDGFEGAVLKDPHSLYEYKRSKVWLKYKPFFDEDLLVSDVELGWLDNNNNIYADNDPRVDGALSLTRALRSAIVVRDGQSTHVGSGFSREQRLAFASGDLVGKVIEVRYQRVSPDGKLIFPRIRGVRRDK